MADRGLRSTPPGSLRAALDRIEHFKPRGHLHRTTEVYRGDGWYRKECACGLVKWAGSWFSMDADQGWMPVPHDEGAW